MRRLLLLGLAILAIGCGEQPPAQNQETTVSGATPAAEKAKQELPAPDLNAESRLGLVRISGRLTKVGMNVDEALANFGEPPNSYEKTDLPPSVGDAGKPYDGWSWQTKDEGFGTILYKGRIAAAVYQHERLNPGQVDDLLRLYNDTFGPPTKQVIGKYVRYWFWYGGGTMDKPDQILMVCTTQVKATTLNATTAVGTSTIMDALGMTFDAATRDQKRADNLFDKQRSGHKPNSSNSSNRGGG